MLDLAIAIGTNLRSTTIVETNHGSKLKTFDWPQDCEFQLVAFNPSGKSCEVVWAESLADDIGMALTMLNNTGVLKGRQPSWYRRLKQYARK